MNLSPLPIQKFFDNNGRPLVGGLLFTYEAGSTTKVATYSDQAGTLNTNPVVLDYRGECRVWLDPLLSYKFVLSPAGDTDPPTKPIWTVDDVAGGLTLADLTRQFLGKILWPLSPAEQSEGITPINFWALSGVPIFDVTRYGASTANSASANSLAIQNAADVAFEAGGGYLYVPAGTYLIDTPIVIRERVSICGAGKTVSILKKTTNTPSPIHDDTVRFWDGAVVGFPITVLHFVAEDDTSSWAYGVCQDLGVRGDTLSPNTTAVEYGFFFRGIVGALLQNTGAEFVQVGYFAGAGNSILSEVAGNIASSVWRGFYQHFMTSTVVHHNIVANYRLEGYFLSGYYSIVEANAADNGGSWKVGTTEICVAYNLNGWKGGAFVGNGCETHNGSVWKWTNCLSTRFANNLALVVSSDYTGISDVVLEEHDSNNSCVYTDNRAQTSGMTGTGARHFIYKITSEIGNYVWQRDRFVANILDTTNTSTWANTSGTIVETTPIVYVAPTAFTPTIIGTTAAGVGTYTTQNGVYERKGNEVSFRLRATWTAHTGTGNIRVAGLPLTAANTEDVPCEIVSDSFTFPGQLAAMINANANTISIYSQATGVALAAVAIDAAATFWIEGHYFVA